MKANALCLILACLSITLVTPVAAEDLTLDQCPGPVKATILSSLQGGTLDKVKTITVDGRTLYSAQILLTSSRDMKLHIDAGGALVKSREEIDLFRAPAAVQAAAKKLIPAGGSIDDVDKEVAEGKTTYLVEFNRPSANKFKVLLAEDGGILELYGK